MKENIDEHITLNTWNKKNNLPIFLRNNYSFYEMTILETRCVLVEVIHEMPNIDQLQKHIKQIKNLTDLHIVLFYKAITRYRRKSLIENRIAFVIEDGQMYLPFLGLDLKKAPEHVDKETKLFTTPAQIAYLYFLYHKDEVVNITEFADKMGFNKMTASRALNNLYHANLITYEIAGKTGRSKEYRRIPDPDYFKNGQAYLKTPVRKIIYTKTKPVGALTAGLDALAGLSMLNSPGHPVLALDRNQLNKEQIEVVNNNDLIKDAKLVELELWDYDPKLFSNKHHVDLVSLYATLKEETDERIEQALEEVLRGESWYRD
ncbi:helix-turn-helix domain-containing protein [Serpentinicella sp. ANB-PHB4]|uniref:MarR family transcriptional regulator n=1 Tax=Serpentinicella sp. ANB-PHB4 TaxID=3074076 RepID=UPI002856C6E0|nr:helix-turn-helix domain-containing protein [Serpentinicella sp. ANB-PHB4]MDR5658546.1 helix-turn-helix domain-containing protein [Serpentinicella sp. ANB-PHB4]